MKQLFAPIFTHRYHKLNFSFLKIKQISAHGENTTLPSRFFTLPHVAKLSIASDASLPRHAERRMERSGRVGSSVESDTLTARHDLVPAGKGRWVFGCASPLWRQRAPKIHQIKDCFAPRQWIHDNISVQEEGRGQRRRLLWSDCCSLPLRPELYQPHRRTRWTQHQRPSTAPG
jgi:hypothetical protein